MKKVHFIIKLFSDFLISYSYAEELKKFHHLHKLQTIYYYAKFLIYRQ